MLLLCAIWDQQLSSIIHIEINFGILRNIFQYKYKYDNQYLVRHTKWSRFIKHKIIASNDNRSIDLITLLLDYFTIIIGRMVCHTQNLIIVYINQLILI